MPLVFLGALSKEPEITKMMIRAGAHNQTSTVLNGEEYNLKQVLLSAGDHVLHDWLARRLLTATQRTPLP